MTIHRVAGGEGCGLHVREWGPRDGRAILLIHGWSQSHYSWVKQFESPLAEEFRLVALDLRGHGMSDKPGRLEDYNRSELWADDIKAVIEALGLQRPVLVGWSYGGFVMSDYIRHHGQAGIAGINFVCAATNLNDQALGHEIGPGFIDTYEATTSDDLPTSLEGIRQFLRRCFAVQPDNDDFELQLAFNACVPARVRLDMTTREIDNRDVLDSLDLPVLITQGSADVTVTPQSAEHIGRHCRTARVSLYDGVAHAPFMEDVTRFNDELAEFARSVAA